MVKNLIEFVIDAIGKEAKLSFDKKKPNLTVINGEFRI